MMRAAWLLCGVLIASACGEGARLSPLDVAAGDGGSAASSSSSSGAAPPTAQKREVYQRHPFGNVAVTDNLLWDGDFEWRPPFAGQYGWYQADSPFLDGVGSSKQAIGPQCKSGLKCASLEPDNVLLGLTVASEGDALAVSFWVRPSDARPSDGACTGIAATLRAQESFTPSEEILPTGATPDADGWCHFEGVVSEKGSAQFLYIHNESTQTALIDDATVVAAPSSTATMRSSSVIDPVDDDRVRAALAALRRPRILPKGAGEIAWDQHQARRFRLSKQP
jgi:hypothetical protein